MAPQGAVGAEFQAPGGGVVKDVLAGQGGLLPLGLVARRVEQRGRRIEQRAGLEGERCDTGGAAYLRTHLRDVGNGKVRGDGVKFVHDELHDLVGRGAGDGIGLGVGEGRRHEGDVTVCPEQFEIEVSPEEAEFVREQFHLLNPVGIIGVILPLGDVRLLDFLHVHADIGDGRIALCPGIGIGIGGTPSAVGVVVHGTGLQRVLGLVGGSGKEVGAIGSELVIIDLRVNVEYHVLDAILEVFVCPCLVTRVLLGVVEVDAGGREDTGENE